MSFDNNQADMNGQEYSGKQYKSSRIVQAVLLYSVMLLIIASVSAGVMYGKAVDTVSESGVTPSVAATVNPEPTEPPTMTPQPTPTQIPATLTPSPSPTPTVMPTPDEEYDVWDNWDDELSEESKQTIGDRFIVLQKPEAYNAGGETQLTLFDFPVDKTIRLTIENCRYTELSYENFQRVSDTNYYNAEPPTATPTPTPSPTVLPTAAPDVLQTPVETPAKDAVLTENPEETVTTEPDTENLETPETTDIPEDPGRDPLRGLTTSVNQEEGGSYTVTVDLLLDKTYVYNVYETEKYYYISLKEGKDVYDKIIVIDAGHGGWDTGTSSPDGAYLEKDMNLSMLLYLAEYLEQEEDITVYYTRTTDRSLTLSQRIDLANSLGADFFISIHCNNAYQNSTANGTEVLYTQYQNEWQGLNSKTLANICLEELIEALNLNNRGLVPRGDSVTVLNEAKVPAALVEIGFMSNEGDLAVIIDEGCRKKAAEAIYSSVLRAYELLEAEE